MPGVPAEAVPSSSSYNSGFTTHQSMLPPPPMQVYHPDSVSSAQVPLPPPPQSSSQHLDKLDNPHLRSPIRTTHLTNAVSPRLSLRSRTPIPLASRHRVLAPETTTATTVADSSTSPVTSAAGGGGMTGNNSNNNTSSSSIIAFNRGARSPGIVRPGAPAPKDILPLSLASITSHSRYAVAEPQPKNCLAQMLRPGERLRTVSLNPRGPAVLLSALLLWITRMFDILRAPLLPVMAATVVAVVAVAGVVIQEVQGARRQLDGRLSPVL
ncbi:hypothetical protein AX17_007195 [Amanita inopinata Kibby_2008]|nr:hypothetical protein AX17_007195 [Amanita inopinata Kibby_2008]